MGIINIEPATLGGMRFLFSFYGLSETGKTLSALRVAAGIEPDPRKRMLLDTEGGQRGRAYVNEISGGYLYASLSPPYTPERYIQALDEIEAAGVTVLVTDSASHSWFAEGGVLAMVEESALKNDLAKWKDPKRRLGKMMQRYRSSDMHHILCSRAKQPLIDGPVVNGKKTLVLGPVVPIQEKMMRYDMTVIAHMLGRGQFTVEAPQGKCPGNLLSIFQSGELMNEDMGRRLAEWVAIKQRVSPEVRALKVEAAEAAARGLSAYGDFWQRLGRDQRQALLAGHDNFKSIAAAADDERARSAAEVEAEATREDEDQPELDAPFGRAGIDFAGADQRGPSLEAAGGSQDSESAAPPDRPSQPEQAHSAPAPADDDRFPGDLPPGQRLGDGTSMRVPMLPGPKGRPDYRAWAIAAFLPKLKQQRDLSSLTALMAGNADSIEAARRPGALNRDDLTEFEAAIKEQFRLVENG